jgi:predicted DsbA family dithiol-disulfide isomerase
VVIKVDVFSDVICPWCFILKRKMEKAIEKLGDGYELDIKYMPFQLNPTMPKNGLDRKEYRSAKFGSWEKSMLLDRQVWEVGKREGISFNFEIIKRTPNTFEAHRLIWLGRSEGVQNEVVEALFSSYFVHGADVGDRDTLVQIAIEAGIDRKRVDDFFSSNEGVEEVMKEEEIARNARISAVPSVYFNGVYAFSGAQSAEVITELLKRANQEEESWE